MLIEILISMTNECSVMETWLQWRIQQCTTKNHCGRFLRYANSKPGARSSHTTAPDYKYHKIVANYF